MMRFEKFLGLVWFIPLYFLFTGYIVKAAIWSLYVSLFFLLVATFLWKRRKSKDNIQNLQNELRLDHVSFYTSKVGRKSAIGGFVVPILPFFVVVKSEGKLTEEAIIHEHMHLRWATYGLQTALFYWMLVGVYVWFGLNFVVIMSAILLWLLLQEFLTFGSTKRFAEEKGIKARSFGKNILAKYLLFYGSYLAIFLLLSRMVAPEFGLLLMVALYWILGKFWYFAFIKMGLSQDVSNR